jgi:hypothetical protein
MGPAIAPCLPLYGAPANPDSLGGVDNRAVATTAVLGDIHGDFDRMEQLVAELKPNDRLITVGDYFDRWDQALEVVHWLMERPNTTALLGNHDAIVLGALEELENGESGRATENWLWNGGQSDDLVRLRRDPQAAAWLRERPAMATVGKTLVQHCDSPVYLLYGRTVDEVNRTFGQRLRARDPNVYIALFAHLCRRREFYAVPDLKDYLAVFGAKRLVHGHTPHTRPGPISLFNDRIVNIDGALSRGFGPGERGFLYWIEAD